MTTTVEAPQTTATAATPEENTLFTLPAADVHNALANVIHFASKDDTLPILSAVNFVFDPATRTLNIRATDRYQIIYVKLAENIEEKYPEFDATISHADAKKLITVLRGHKKFSDSLMQIDFQDDRAEFIYYADGLEKIETVRLVEGQYPQVGGIFSGIYEGRAQNTRTAPARTTFDSMQMYNVDFLANVAKLKDYRETPRNREKGLTLGVASKGGQLSFWFSDWAHGFVMPLMASEQRPRPAETVPTWITK